MADHRLLKGNLMPGNTARHAIPYPVLNDDPRTYPTQVGRPLADRIDTLIQNLVNRLSNLEEPGTWTSFNATGAWLGKSAIEYRLDGHKVYLQGKLQQSSDVASGSYTAFTLPTAVRPTRDVFAPIVLRKPWGTTPQYQPEATIQISSSTGLATVHCMTSAEALMLNVTWPIGE